MLVKKELFVLSPFECPNVGLALETLKSGAFPVLHLGRNKEHAEKSLKELCSKTDSSFGVCIASNEMLGVKLPNNVTKVVIPIGINIKLSKNVKILHQVHSLDEIEQAAKLGYKSIVLKGNEGAGKVAYKSSFVLFQGVKKKYPETQFDIYIQGGAGIHSSAAMLALGAKGVIVDSQVSLFPESRMPKELKNVFSKLSGSETVLIDNFRILLRKNSPKLPENAVFKDIKPYLGGLELSENILPVGQDIALAIDLVEKYKKLKDFVLAFHEAAYGHLLQAKSLRSINNEGPLAKELGVKYPIAQGPMARVSDVPEFAEKIAEGGALPFIAMSLMTGDAAKNAVMETSKLLREKPWGVGILGFAPVQLRDEQMKYILEAKPSVVIIAGGRPSLAKPYEKEGITTFLHVPSTNLLDMFLKEGAKKFIFEGRESGGHVGPLSSLVLWEKQTNRLLKEDDLSPLQIFFAGGIHDAISSAFVSIMSATLSAKGAKVGVLMGTSYLYTKEAVEAGAILDEYQKQSVQQNKTVLLEAAPGQETRALESPFTEFFKQEKLRLLSEGLDSKDVWIKLEELNIGRLRIASKGIERQEGGLVKLNNKDQFEKGVYMIGQVAALRNEVISVAELHSHVAEDNNKLIAQLEKIAKPEIAEPLKIAIVGMAGIFPGVKNLDEYWRNILLGKNCVTEVPDSRWNKELFYNPDTRDTDYVSSKWGGFIPTIDFDPLEFGIPPQSLASIEPVQLLSLLVAKRALEDAGYDMKDFDGENTSVIIGAEGATDLAASYGFRGYAKQVFGELPEELKNILPKLNEDSFPGVLSNVVAGRITNRLNLGGTNFTVDAACGASLAAMDVACQELQNNKADIVVCGGADFHNGLNDYLMFSATYALSRKGYCASFDADSDGIALGEGIGMVILKRFEDAERDGDRIYAVVRGTGASSDGKSLGMTAPNKKGQMKALQRAYKNAGVLPSEVELVEAHGTGTVVGDKTELSALTDMFLESGALPGQAHLGSVKTQIGHTKCAAGIAGVIKTALATYYGVKPPTINLNHPNSFYNKETSPFKFNTKAGLWNSDKRISGVSAFGFGGTNFHVVMENYKKTANFPTTLNIWFSELFVFRGDSLEEAKQLMKKVKNLLEINDNIQLKDIAFSLVSYNNKDIQISLVAGSNDDLQEKINNVLSGTNEENIYLRKKQEGKLAFLFSGQGSQRINMARDLFVAFPSMRKLLLQNPEYETLLFPSTVFDEASKKAQSEIITKTENAQPVLGMVDLAIAEFLKSLGMEPDMLAGHSFGELPALCFSGVFDSEELVSLSRKRAESILKAVGKDKGMMIAVGVQDAELKDLLKDEKEIWAVNFNSQKQTILAGSTPAMKAFIEKLKEQKIFCKELMVDCAFHSPLLAKAKGNFSKELKKISFKTPEIPVWSNTTAQVYPQKSEEIKERLSEHLIQPVLFKQQLENMYEEGARVFIETGPGKVLTGLAQTILADKQDVVTIQTEEKEKEGISFILNAIAKYLATGRSLNIDKLFEGRIVNKLDFEALEQYKKKPTIWHVNGHNALPSTGKLPPNGALPITQPIALNGLSIGGNGNLIESDHIMLDYLNNMKTVIQNQRDVMLGYFGQVPTPHPQVTEAVVGYSQIRTVQSAEVAAQTIQNGVPSTQQAAVYSVEDIKKMLLETVSDKTGYPIDMLGLDLDLEADLSIDSIKRIEVIGDLKDKLGITTDFEESEDAIERMASIKTLRGLIDWIEELVQENQQALTTSQNTTTEAVQAISAPVYSVEEIKKILLETVSDKTGYPIDMLGLDLDLEADLSIDSIKRIEIIGDLKDKLGITADFEESEDAIERMASIKTLRGLIKWIEELADPAAQEALKKEMSNTSSKNQTNEISFDTASISALEESEETILRARLELESWKDEKAEILSVEGKKFALTDDGGILAEEIKKLILKKGGNAEIIKGTEDLSGYDGLVVINSSKSNTYYTINDVFSMIKSADTEKIKWIYVFSDIMGDLESKKDIGELKHELKNIQGFPGLIKSLAREYSDINCRAVVSLTVFDEKQVPKIVMDELETTDISSEIIYKGSKRFRCNLVADVLPINGNSDIKLNKESVILVLGGAQGITAELTRQLSEEYPCHYILVGRSPKPVKSSEKYTTLVSKEEIRKYLILEEQMKVPAEIEKKAQKIFKENQIINTITNIEKTGSKVTYKSLDVSNQESLRKLIKDIYKKYGKIDGVIHAAGLLVDKLFVHKTQEAFEHVYTTKINPLHVLLEELQTDVQFVVFFSSIASVYGNRGQSDYAAANSVFDLTSWAVRDKIDAKFLAINWGPWKGAGMVSSALENEFKKRNVPMIPLLEGGKTFVNELKYGKDNQVVIMGGSEVKQFFGI